MNSSKLPLVRERLTATRPTHIRRATGLDVTNADLWRLREGDTSCMSDNRLLLLGERLGLRFAVTVH